MGESRVDELPPFNEAGHLHVLIETSQGSPNKLKWDSHYGLFRLSGVLPAGAVFPYDFGLVPGTIGPDGDPLDVLLLMDQPVPTGCLVEARLIGVIEATQTEKEATVHNDRLLAVAVDSRNHRRVHELRDLDPHLLEEIEHFFVSYNQMKGREFKVLARRGPARARSIICAAQKDGAEGKG